MLMIKFLEYNNHPSYSNKIKHILKYSFIPPVVYNVRRNDCENKFKKEITFVAGDLWILTRIYPFLSPLLLYARVKFTYQSCSRDVFVYKSHLVQLTHSKQLK